MSLKRILIFALVMFTSLTANAKPPKTVQQSTYSSLNFTVTKPNQQWKFDNLDIDNQATLRFKRYRDDITINVQFFDAINVLGRDRRRFKQKFWYNIFQKAMKQPYLDRQFRIVSFKPLDNNTIQLEGVNSDRDYLLVNLHFTKKNYYGNYVAVETILKSNDYLEFRDAFHAVSSSITLN